MRISFYKPTTKNQKYVHLAESLEKVCASIDWVDPSTPLFALLEEIKPDVVFLNGSENPEHVKYAKHDYPDVKFILVSEQSVDSDVYDKIIYLSEIEKDNGVYLDFLVNEWHCNGEEIENYKTDILFISDGYEKSDFVEEALNSLGDKFTLKIYGRERVDSIYYLGGVNRLEYKNLIASSKIVVMFDREWLHTIMNNGKVPLVYNVKKTNQCEFSNYDELVSACEELMDMSMEKTDLKTYTEFCKEIIEEL